MKQGTSLNVSTVESITVKSIYKLPHHLPIGLTFMIGKKLQTGTYKLINQMPIHAVNLQ